MSRASPETATLPAPQLLSPFTVRGLTLKNRIVVSPMCQYSAIDGVLTDWHLVHLGRFALGGAALVFVEATGVEARGRISPGDSGLWNDDQARALARIAEFLKANGAAAGLQLAHAGRKASTAAVDSRCPPSARCGPWSRRTAPNYRM